MSYILDALRRADSERERGAVPSIHSAPVPPVVDEATKPSRGQPQRVLVAVIVVLLLALVGLLAWHLMSGKEAPVAPVAVTAPVLEAQPAPSERTPASPPPQAVQAVPQVPSVAPAPAPAPAFVQAPRPEPAPMQRAPTAVVPQPQAMPTPAPSLAAAPPVVTVPARPAPTQPATVTAPMPPVAQTPQADTRVYAVNDLPANIQRELPKLVVGGAMYSDTPANRMLIINSQVFREGDKLSADLLLQEIKLKSAVFQYKGYRYGVNY